MKDDRMITGKVPSPDNSFFNVEEVHKALRKTEQVMFNPEATIESIDYHSCMGIGTTYDPDKDEIVHISKCYHCGEDYEFRAGHYYHPLYCYNCLAYEKAFMEWLNVMETNFDIQLKAYQVALLHDMWISYKQTIYYGKQDDKEPIGIADYLLVPETASTELVEVLSKTLPMSIEELERRTKKPEIPKVKLSNYKPWSEQLSREMKRYGIIQTESKKMGDKLYGCNNDGYNTISIDT